MATEKGQLIVQFEGKIIQTLPLTDEPFLIGRSPDVGLTLPHPLVSREHAELAIKNLNVVLTDLGSSNGTFIGNERLGPRQPRILTDGTSFRIGPYFLTYRASDASPFIPDDVHEESEEQQAREEGIYEQASEARKHFQQVLRSPGQETSSLYMRFLPDIYQENDFLRRFLLIFEEIWEPLEQRQDHIHMYFHPLTCPVVLLPWLASWLDFPLDPHWPEMRQRRILAQAMDIYRWRGTRYGLVRMLEVCTGITPIITEMETEPFVFHIEIPLAAGKVDKKFINDLIQAQKPAHAGYVLEWK